jgi:hypothetical protein
MEPREWDITNQGSETELRTVTRFKGTYVEACARAREIYAETRRMASVWTGLTLHFCANQYGERNWN